MMKAFYKVLLQAAFVFILYWIFAVVLEKHETWVFPEIEGVVVQLEDETLPIAGMEVVAQNSEVGDRRATTDESGKFSFPAIIRMRRALGDQCYSTQVSVTDFNETVVTFDALICNAELAVSTPPTKYTLTFRLATKHSVEASRVDGIWQRAGSRGIAVGIQKEEEIPSARYKNVATPKRHEIRDRLRPVGTLAPAKRRRLRFAPPGSLPLA